MKIEPMPEGVGALIARMAADDRKAASELATPETAGPAKVVAAVATGSVAGEKLTKRQLGNVAAWLNSSRQLEKMTPRELIDETLKSDAADYDIVIELMNRVLPGWATDDTEDQPQNDRGQTRAAGPL